MPIGGGEKNAGGREVVAQIFGFIDHVNQTWVVAQMDHF